jgi:hypothetical protein
MIDAVNVPAQSVAVNGSVIFSNTRVRTGCSVRHEQGSGRFVTLKPGVYEVTFTANVSETTITQPIVMSIVQDGEIVAGSTIQMTPATASTPHNVSTTVLIPVYEYGGSSIGVRNIGTSAISVQDANFVITREC